MSLLDLVTFIVAWSSPAIALVAVWLTNRSRWDGRAIVNVASIQTTDSGVELELSNDGGRAALDILVVAEGAAASRDGIRVDDNAQLELVGTGGPSFAFTLSYSDIDGRRYCEERLVVVGKGGALMIEPRRKEHVVAFDRPVRRWRAESFSKARRRRRPPTT